MNLAHIKRIRKPYKIILYNILLVLLVSFVSYLVYLYRVNDLKLTTAENLQNGITANQKIVKIKDTDIIVDIADTPEKRATGLMNIESLDVNKGMLFIFDKEERHGFWMKNTLIPLDIIWIDKNKTVVYISHNTQPCKSTISSLCPSVDPEEKSMYVLEINAGKAAELGLNVGDKIDFN